MKNVVIGISWPFANGDLHLGHIASTVTVVWSLFLCWKGFFMKKKTVFTGAATALVTPFDENGVNYEKLGRLIDWQIDSGIDALVVCGTTGEASTMTDDEHRMVIDYSVKRAAGRVPVIAGAGSNDTAYALDLVRCAEQSGADAMLVVTPYYNKCTQTGLIKMFTQIADASSKPIILYKELPCDRRRGR